MPCAFIVFGVRLLNVRVTGRVCIICDQSSGTEKKKAVIRTAYRSFV
jgi:hypothetical protein